MTEPNRSENTKKNPNLNEKAATQVESEPPASAVLFCGRCGHELPVCAEGMVTCPVCGLRQCPTCGL